MTVNRQKVIGNYIVDFYIHSAKLVIEIDGAQHNESEHKKKDEIRDSFLSEHGITVLRYGNETIRNYFSVVCEDVLKHLGLEFSSLRGK